MKLRFILAKLAVLLLIGMEVQAKPQRETHSRHVRKHKVPARKPAQSEAGQIKVPAWVTHARRLSGETDSVRNHSIRTLKTTPQLETILREALTSPRRYLALDVISTLKLKNLAPDLIKLSEHDETGTYYLALNSLIHASDENQFKELYAKRLLSGESPAVARMILLDTLSRMQFRLTPRQLRELLIKDDSPEVRSSALSYLRDTLLKPAYDDFIPLLRELLELKKISPQLKMQTLFLASEISPELFQQIRDIRAPCPHPAPAPIKERCEQFLDGSLQR